MINGLVVASPLLGFPTQIRLSFFMNKGHSLHIKASGLKGCQDKVTSDILAMFTFLLPLGLHRPGQSYYLIKPLLHDQTGTHIYAGICIHRRWFVTVPYLLKNKYPRIYPSPMDLWGHYTNDSSFLRIVPHIASFPLPQHITDFIVKLILRRICS